MSTTNDPQGRQSPHEYDQTFAGTETRDGAHCTPVPGSEARCPKCNGVGYHVRVRNFDTEDADVWECQSPLCTAFGLLWHTPRPKDALGEMRCALLALVEAEKASRDNFDSNAIERIERAMQRADRVLFPERYPQNNDSADMWTYSKYRASLRRNGHPFAIVTPDGKNALNENDIEIILAALNGNPPNEKDQPRRGDAPQS